VFSAVAAFRLNSPGLSDGTSPEQVVSAEVSPGYFDVLRTAPARGRAFEPGDFAQGARRVVIISDSVWQRRFGGDPATVGRVVLVNAVPTEVVGVMPPGLFAPGWLGSQPEIWVPRTPGGALATNRRAHLFVVVGRLRTGETVESARTRLDVVSRRIGQQSGGVDPDMQLTATGLHARMVEPIRPALLILWTAVGLVLVIGAANIANLLLMQGSVRARELAIRRALGANRARLVRQLGAESVLLGLTGGLIGTAMGAWSIPLLASLLPASLPRAAELQADGRVIAFGLLLSVLAAVVLGTVPALRASAGQAGALRDRTGAPPSARLRTLLVAGEVALTVVLLAAAGLLGRSFAVVTRIDPGFDPTGVVALDLTLPGARYSGAPGQAAFYENALARLATLPGVTAAAVTGALPMTGTAATTMVPEGGHVDRHFVADVITASPQYFNALQIPLRRGRLFGDADRRGAAPVALVNEAAARQFWPAGTSPLGRALTMEDWGAPYRAEVIGIIGDVHQAGLEADVRPAVYYPMAQFPEPMLRQSIVVRTSGDPMAVAGSAREQIRLIDRDQPIAAVRPLSDVLGAAVAQRRFNLILIASFAAAALLLAAAGVYGIVAFAVGQRTQEIGVRVALGAGRSDVVRLVLAQGTVPVVAGVAAGIAGALAASRILDTLVFGVRATDAMTLASVALAVAAIALAASIAPARRALRVDPAVALRANP
jgi:putative ABC transport system permease protein